MKVIYRGLSDRLVAGAKGQHVFERDGAPVEISRTLFKQLSADPTIRLEDVTGQEPETDESEETTDAGDANGADETTEADGESGGTEDEE